MHAPISVSALYAHLSFEISNRVISDRSMNIRRNSRIMVMLGRTLFIIAPIFLRVCFVSYNTLHILVFHAVLSLSLIRTKEWCTEIMMLNSLSLVLNWIFKKSTSPRPNEIITFGNAHLVIFELQVPCYFLFIARSFSRWILYE